MNELFTLSETKPPALLTLRKKVHELAQKILAARWFESLDDVIRYGPGWTRTRLVNGHRFVEMLSAGQVSDSEVGLLREEMGVEVESHDTEILLELWQAARELAAEERNRLGRIQR